MLQVIFNAISAAEMAALPKELQLDILAEFPFLPQDFENLDASRFGKVRRDGRTLFRCRARDYRIYFDLLDGNVRIHRVLHRNTIRDFLFRSNLPMDEDEQLGDARGFWQLIEEAEKKA